MICHDNKFIEVEEEGVKYYQECECAVRERKESRLRFANIPESLKKVSLETFDLTNYKGENNRNKARIACQCIKEYLNQFKAMKERGMGLYIYSETRGSGKTRMAASIANELLKDYQVKFATSQKIIDEIKRSWDKDAEYSESKVIDDLCNAEILIVDDFGVEKISDWVNEKFYHIINERYLKEKVTMFTSNESIENVQYDSRITSRIKEKVFEIHFPEESVRDLIKQKNDNEFAGKK